MSTSEDILEVYLGEVTAWQVRELYGIDSRLSYTAPKQRDRRDYFRVKDQEPERKRKNREAQRRRYARMKAAA